MKPVLQRATYCSFREAEGEKQNHNEAKKKLQNLTSKKCNLAGLTNTHTGLLLYHINETLPCTPKGTVIMINEINRRREYFYQQCRATKKKKGIFISRFSILSTIFFWIVSVFLILYQRNF